MTFSTEVELIEIPRLLTPDLEYKRVKPKTRLKKSRFQKKSGSGFVQQ